MLASNSKSSQWPRQRRLSRRRPMAASTRLSPSRSYREPASPATLSRSASTRPSLAPPSSWPATEVGPLRRLAPLANGSYTLSATQQAASGGPSSAAATDTFTVNVQTAPPAPAFTAPTNGGAGTTTTEPVISGTGVAGDIVTLSIGSTVLSSSIAVAGDGNWTFTPTTPLANGSYTLTATQAASGGPSSTAATDMFTVNVPNNVPTAPPAPAFTAPANGGTDTTTTEPVISGTGVAGDIVTLSIGSTVLSSSIVVAGDGSWTFTPTAPIANGSFH